MSFPEPLKLLVDEGIDEPQQQQQLQQPVSTDNTVPTELEKTPSMMRRKRRSRAPDYGRWRMPSADGDV